MPDEPIAQPPIQHYTMELECGEFSVVLAPPPAEPKKELDDGNVQQV
jgi:hypothetical protein